MAVYERVICLLVAVQEGGGSVYTRLMQTQRNGYAQKYAWQCNQLSDHLEVCEEEEPKEEFELCDANNLMNGVRLDNTCHYFLA